MCVRRYDAVAGDVRTVGQLLRERKNEVVAVDPDLTDAFDGIAGGIQQPKKDRADVLVEVENDLRRAGIELRTRSRR